MNILSRVVFPALLLATPAASATATARSLDLAGLRNPVWTAPQASRPAGHVFFDRLDVLQLHRVVGAKREVDPKPHKLAIVAHKGGGPVDAQRSVTGDYGDKVGIKRQAIELAPKHGVDRFGAPSLAQARSNHADWTSNRGAGILLTSKPGHLRPAQGGIEGNAGGKVVGCRGQGSPHAAPRLSFRACHEFVN